MPSAAGRGAGEGFVSVFVTPCWRAVRRYRRAWVITGAVLGALLFVVFWGRLTLDIGIGRVEVGIGAYPWGYTTIDLPPAGTISARTHLAPLTVRIGLERIDLQGLEQFLATTDAAHCYAALMDKVRGPLIVYGMYIGGLFIAGGLVGGILAGARGYRQLLVCGLVGALTGIILLLCTYFTYDLGGFRQARYDGALRAAPLIMEWAEKYKSESEDWFEELRSVVGNIARLEERAPVLSPRVSGERIRVLLVADIHNNPAAYKLIAQVADEFGAAFIIDAGDISDLGTALEARLVRQLTELDRPYLFVPGNHDSPAVINELKKMELVQVLDGETVSVHGMTILGVADELARGTDITPTEESIALTGRRLEMSLEKTDRVPDLVVVHDPSAAAGVMGRVPLIVHGHIHRFRMEKINGTVVIGPGTTGGAGIQSFQQEKEIPLGMALLTFGRQGGGWVLNTVDRVEFYARDGAFIIERRAASA